MPALRLPARKFAAAVAVVVVTVGLAVAGAVAASAAPASPRVAQKYQTDHELCYTARASGPGIKLPPPGSVTLENQFGSFKPAFPSFDPVEHCNPVEKILPDGQRFPVTNHSAHALCWMISGDRTKQPLVVISNQFGQADLLLGQASLICLPTWKSLTGPPHMTSSQPAGLSHYTCYPVRQVTSGGYKAPGLKLKDEFAAQPVNARLTSTTPTQLCVPTTKIVVTPAGRKIYPVVPGARQLLCFPVTQTPRKTPVFDQDQFTGPGVRITITKTLTLCVPSTRLATPALTTSPSPGGTAGGPAVTDTATLSGGTNPTGTITFALYGPSPTADCSGTPAFTSTKPVSGGTATSAPFTPTLAGAYWWTASYSGDPSNTPASSGCGAEQVTVAPPHIYWTTDNGIVAEANLNGTGVTTLETGQNNPTGVAVDSSHLYWGNDNSGTGADGTIAEASLNGTGVTTLETGQNNPVGVAVDSSHIYWANGGGGTIMEANLNGTGVTTLVTGQNSPYGVAVDGSHVYWADYAGGQTGAGTIMEANLNGTGVTTLVTGRTGPLGVAVDGSHIYWAETPTATPTNGTIMEANLNGTGVTTLITGEDVPVGVAVDGSHVYWADFGGSGLIMKATRNVHGGTIMEANLNGTGVTTLITGQDEAFEVAVGP